MITLSQNLSWSNLLVGFLPVLVVLAVMYSWSLNAYKAGYALFRMVLQLLLIGYLLSFIFAAQSPAWMLPVLMVMLLASSWIALGIIETDRKSLFPLALLAIGLGGGVTLMIVIAWELDINPWYEPRFLIPLAGMIFASAMNSVSLSAERFLTETSHGAAYSEARNSAIQVAMIPVINSLFAVGLVSLPGMMTGQILSGVEPVIAARYQMMVMCMIFSASGLSAICFLMLIKIRMSEK